MRIRAAAGGGVPVLILRLRPRGLGA